MLSCREDTWLVLCAATEGGMVDLYLQRQKKLSTISSGNENDSNTIKKSLLFLQGRSKVKEDMQHLWTSPLDASVNAAALTTCAAPEGLRAGVEHQPRIR
jgi:hypothetical protein